MQRWQLILPFVLALSTIGCIRGACDWGGCDDLGDGFCIWYEGDRAGLVYFNAEKYAEAGCNWNSASASVSGAALNVQHSDRFILFSERHTHHSELPAGWGDRADPRATGIYHWIIDKEANNAWRHSGEIGSNRPLESAIVGPLDSLAFVS